MHINGMERLRRPVRTSSAPFLDMGKEIPHPGLERSFSAVSFCWRTLFLPSMGLIFLAFCYICRYKIVEVGSSTGPLSQLPIIKAGVTSLGIIFVTLSLWPLSSLLSDLKSEEFFRALRDKRQGVRLASLNNISTPSRGILDSLMILFSREGSNYFAATFVVSFAFLAASALAPAALSVDTILFDGDVVALQVAAIPINSVIWIGNSSNTTASTAVSDSVTNLMSRIGSFTWAEVSLGVNYTFMSPTVDDTVLAVPMPVKLTPNITASWLSDVVAMRPACDWVAPNIRVLSENINPGISVPRIIMDLDSKKIQLNLSQSDVPKFFDTRVSIAPLTSTWYGEALDKIYHIDQFGTHAGLMDGTIVWMVVRCIEGPECKSERLSIGNPNADRNTTSIAVGPDFRSSPLNVANGTRVDFSFLVCTPNAEIQTRRIHNDGTGLLKVEDPIPVRQGNLHAAQTRLLLSYMFKKFDKAGPTLNVNITGLGNQPQLSLFCGNNAQIFQNQATLSPIETITKYYGRFVQSGLKNFMDGGALGSAFVPSRGIRKRIVLSPSMPHVIISTVLYVVLSVFVAVCYFRRPSPQFTLSTVASSLEKSRIPPIFDQLNQSAPEPHAESNAMAVLGEARIVSERLSDGSQILKLRNRLSHSSGADHEMVSL